ncbi:MAG: hypothetical protein CMK59_15525 [Proteobacteria bacterium]|nr:hypothetical protein [Pseudomonadota bacterium]
MLVNAGFLATWRIIPPHLPELELKLKLGLMVFCSLSCWALAASSSYLLLLWGGATPLFWGGLALLIQLFVGIFACWNNPPSPKGSKAVSLMTLFLRGCLAATAIVISVLLAQSGSPLLAGIASVFPAIFLTTMVSVWISQGEAVQAGAVGPMMLGSSAVSAYALIAIFSFSMFGPWVGALIAWGASVFFCSVPIAFWMSRQH